MINPPRSLGLLSTLVYLSACSALMPTQDREQNQQLQSALATCQAGQSTLTTAFNQYRKTLEKQSDQLDKLTADIAELNSRKPTVAPPPTMMELDCPAPETKPGKVVVGRLEQVWLKDLKLALPARVDTGAETASLDARNIQTFERDGKRWVRFEVLHPETGAALTLERRLVRSTRIRQANSEVAERRAVVRLGIVIGPFSQNAEFTLSDRRHLDHQLLIGRNILKDLMVVDVSEKNIAPYVPDAGEPVQ